MRVAGEEAKRRQAVRLDSCEQVNRGQLTIADDENGFVQWLDPAGELKSVTLGQHAIRILARSSYGR